MTALLAKLSAAIVAGAIAVGLATLAHCGSDSLGTSDDSGADTATGMPDGTTGIPDGEAPDRDFPGQDASPPRNLFAVHASPDLFAFRICIGWTNGASAFFNTGAIPWPYDDAHPMPRSSYAGIAVGGGAALPGAIVPLTRELVVYLLDARALATSANPKALCSDRVGPQCVGASCLPASEFEKLPPIDTAGLSLDAMLVAVAGCRDPHGPCYRSYPLKPLLVPLFLQRTVTAIDQIDVELAHVATSTGPVVATLDTSDAGAFTLNEQWTGPNYGTLIALPAPSSPEWESRGVAIQTATDAGLRMSLADVQRVSDPSLTPWDFFKSVNSYAFVLVGDPNATNALYADGGINPSFDGTALHFVAISTTPPGGG